MSSSQPLHIVCVLRTGGDFGAQYVNTLYNVMTERVTAPFTFTCLTNDSTGFNENIRIVDLQHDWPGWWAKLELFKPGIWEDGSRIWYFDLDTVITNNIDEIVSSPLLNQDIFATEDFMVPKRLMSTVMTWMANDPDMAQVYYQFAEKPDRVMMGCSTLSDQCWIGIMLPKVTYFQSLFPDKFVSFKMHCINGGLPATASIVCFHGKPRPHEAVKDNYNVWVRSYWR